MSHEPQPKEFYCKYQGFEFKSGVDDVGGRVIDYQVMTDNLQGIKFCTDGTHFQLNLKLVMNFAVKIVILVNPQKLFVQKWRIHIDALNGDIILKGTNIRLQPTDSWEK